MSMFIMVAGPSGSGKSFWAEAWKDKNPDSVVISTDAIRKHLFGDEACQVKPYKVFSLAYKLIEKYLKEGYNVLFDAMNLRAKDRLKVLKMVDDLHLDILNWRELIVIESSLETCLKSQELRERKVPKEIIEGQFKRFQKPTDYEESKWSWVRTVKRKEI